MKCPKCKGQDLSPLTTEPSSASIEANTSSPTMNTTVSASPSLENSSISSNLPISGISSSDFGSVLPPDNAENPPIEEEPLPEGVTQEAMADLKGMGPQGEAAADLVNTMSQLPESPEQLTVEECTDIFVSIYELEAIPIVMIFDKDVKDADDPRIFKHLQSSGRALYRYFRRHPEKYKGGMADMLDMIIIFMGATLPIQTAGIEFLRGWLKERKEKKKLKQQEQQVQLPNSVPTPPNTDSANIQDAPFDMVK